MIFLQLFENLLHNAIKFHSEKPLIVQVSAKRKIDEWIIAVADNGVGFDMEYSERIFVMFERLIKNADGNGVGLALCKAIVDFHNGRIWAESKPGEGSTFYVAFQATE